MTRLRIVLVTLASVAALVALVVTAVLVWPSAPDREAQSEASTAGDIHMLLDDNFGTVESFVVDDAGVLQPTPDPGSPHAAVWDAFLRVATPEFASAVVVEFRVGDRPDVNTLAYVENLDDGDGWIVAANIGAPIDLEHLVPTLVHEFAHILTLSSDQMQAPNGPCLTLETGYGCLRADAALQQFSERFWAPYGDDAPDTNNGDPEVTTAFYTLHEEEFVDWYSATSVIEDIAESFMIFVFEDRPTGDSPLAQKLGFFWEVPEYVELRERIRAEFRGLTPIP